jgi:hypothetical protein
MYIQNSQKPRSVEVPIKSMKAPKPQKYIPITTKNFDPIKTTMDEWEYYKKKIMVWK